MKILHLTFHNGPTMDLKYISNELNVNIQTKFFDDGTNGKYNIGFDRAKNYWDKHKEYFKKFDMIITSDTAPLSRIFLQHNWPKKLIIWINNRFDYCDVASLDCEFPDKHYYDLIREAINKNNVSIYGYTKFENFYCKNIRNIDVGDKVIKPIGLQVNLSSKKTKLNNKSDFIFVGSYHNDNIMIKLKYKLIELGLSVYNGRYFGPLDLKEFKCVVHIPYAWSNYAIFESFHYGIVYLIPSSRFFKELKQSKNFFWSPPYKDKYLELSEWYDPEYKDIFVYFDSWEELKSLSKNFNFKEHQEKLIEFSKKHKEKYLDMWKKEFSKINDNIK